MIVPGPLKHRILVEIDRLGDDATIESVSEAVIDNMTDEERRAWLLELIALEAETVSEVLGRQGGSQ